MKILHINTDLVLPKYIFYRMHPEDSVRYQPTLVHRIKKACYTDTHIVFLYEDGRVGYVGQSTGRSCTGLNKINDAIDISATLYETVVTRKNMEMVRFPKHKKLQY